MERVFWQGADKVTLTVKAPVTVGHGLNSACSGMFTSPILLNALKAPTGSPTRPALKPSGSLQYAKAVYSLTRQGFGKCGQTLIPYSVLTGTDNSGKQSRDVSSTLFHERLIKMLPILADMAVNLGKHGTIGMSHKRGNGQVIVSGDELASTEAMPHAVGKDVLADLARELNKAITERELSPRRSSAIQEKIARTIFGHKSVDDFKRSALQIDYAFSSLAFRLFRREDNTLFVEFDMAAFNGSRLLRSASGMPKECKNISEGVAVFDTPQNSGKVIRGHIGFPALGRRLLHAIKGAGFKMPLLYSPIKDALYGDNSATAIGASPSGLTVNPFRDMEGLYCGSLKVSNSVVLEKVKKIAGVPFVRALRPVLLTPQKVLRNECMNVCHAHQYNHIFGVNVPKITLTYNFIN
jgi:hypothetical protein